MFKDLFFKTVQNNLFLPMTILESDWLVFDFEDPLWGDELLSRLTSWLDISYFLSPCMSRPLLWSAGILRYYILNDNIGGTFDANSFTKPLIEFELNPALAVLCFQDTLPWFVLKNVVKEFTSKVPTILSLST